MHFISTDKVHESEHEGHNLMRDAKPHGQQCTATAKRTGQRCKQTAVTGYSVCRMHGAGSPHKGRPGGRPIVTGRYSKRLPERLAGKFQDAQADPRLLELRDEVALVDVRLGELVERIDVAGSAARWQALRTAYADLQSAAQRSDTAGFKTAMAAMGAALQAGTDDHDIWREIVGLTEQRRKLVESERKRLVEMQQMITAERAMVLLAAVVDVIRRHVTDREALALISSEIRQLATVEEHA